MILTSKHNYFLQLFYPINYALGFQLYVYFQKLGRHYSIKYKQMMRHLSIIK